MRAIYNVKILESTSSSPIIYKILGTFFAFWMVLSLFSSLILLGVLQDLSLQGTYSSSYGNFFFIWVFLSIIVHFLLWILLRNSISPLVQLITHFKNSETLQELEIPKNLSEEITDLFQILNKSILNLKALQEKTIEAEKNAAIALTIQLLAHDVRQPFLMLQTILKTLSLQKDMTQINNLIKTLVPQVEKNFQKVNGMLLDVMEMGYHSEKLVLESICPEKLIFSVVKENLQIYNNTDITFIFDFSHKHKIRVNISKIERVFANILLNALQAMNFSGKIWIQTREVLIEKNLFIEFCIGNNNSFIENEDIKNLFNAFFTKAKKSGTGLGLAAAEKIVQSHGGRIWCQSVKNDLYKTGMVEFYFTILASEELAVGKKLNFPTHSSELYQNKFERRII
ncbi:ATP-binding protein [Fluviispira vulneris]|uniref:ATP-binding protein n=1 Tax=Fluviispira vulneris TaxID=2763012 RepID=UPI001644C745|nr:HAMP domain-containing sensor histidine kinase [Fluviispira vulneris]